MGIVNVTPDSFSDGGLFVSREKAIAHARALAKQGADILDIGGESTRPGATPVGVEEELDRILRVVETLVREGFTVSVDTYKPQVMREVLQVGAHIINDIHALGEPGAMEAVVGSGAGLVLMHSQRDPQKAPLADLEAFFRKRVAEAISFSIPKETLCLDPGFGFAKSFEENLEILEGLEMLTALDLPILVGLSRKRMIGSLTGIANPAQRVQGSVQAALKALQKGARIVRVHDVKETLEAIRVAWGADD